MDELVVEYRLRWTLQLRRSSKSLFSPWTRLIVFAPALLLNVLVTETQKKYFETVKMGFSLFHRCSCKM